MTDESIEKLIDSLNMKEGNDLVVLSELSTSIDSARVRIKLPKSADEYWLPFYFIKDKAGVYVGAVHDMGNDISSVSTGSDLHVFVKTDHRRKGHLSQAMNEVILPHLYQSGRKKQRITFTEQKIGQYVERNWGFTIINDTVAEKDLSCYAKVTELSPN